MLRTRLCSLLGIEYPIIQAPMGPDLAGPELVAAVSGAGGSASCRRSCTRPSSCARRSASPRPDRPAVRGQLPPLSSARGRARALSRGAGARALLLLGRAAGGLRRARAHGRRPGDRPGRLGRGCQASAEVGADVVIAQGFEAGGHVAGDVTTMALVPRVVDAVAPTPVAAAGGIADARGLVAALALGAEAVVLGTRMLATTESRAHPLYKKKLLAAGEGDTVHTILFGYGWPHAPHRTLRTAFVQEWLGHEERAQESRPAGEVVQELVDGARRIIGERLAAVCD